MLTSLSHFHKNVKSFNGMTKEDILAFIAGVRKPEALIHCTDGSEVIIRKPCLLSFSNGCITRI
jgi:hypothetical protein